MHDLFQPGLALIHLLVELLSFLLAFKAADPHVEILFLLPHKIPHYHHPLGDLEGKQNFFHVLHPLFHLSFLDPILTQFKKHGVLLSIFSCFLSFVFSL